MGKALRLTQSARNSQIQDQPVLTAMSVEGSFYGSRAITRLAYDTTRLLVGLTGYLGRRKD